MAPIIKCDYTSNNLGRKKYHQIGIGKQLLDYGKSILLFKLLTVVKLAKRQHPILSIM